MKKLALLPLILSALLSITAFADDDELLFQADKVDHDEKQERVIATGHVKLYYFGRTILAERVEYDEKTEFVHAYGNVTIIEPDGQTAFFADEVKLNQEVSEGFMDAVKVYKKPNVRITSARADVKDEALIEMSKSTYTACNLCQTDPNKAPFWQLKSWKTIENRDTHNMTHLGSFIEMGGVPIVPLPFISHPDPTVKQRSGLLAPTYYNSDMLGNSLTLPVYLALDESYDMTVRVTPTEKLGVVLGGEWRHQLENGYYEIDGSYIHTERFDGTGKNKISEGKKNRYHFFTHGNYDINDYFRAGFDINKVSDDSYLDTFQYTYSNSLFEEKNILTSKLYLEGFDDRDYLSVDAYYFDDIRPASSRGNAPLIAPFINVNALGDPSSLWGGRLSFDTSFVNLSRDHRNAHLDDQDMQRFTADLGWERTFVSDCGLVNTVELHGIGRNYQIQHYQAPMFSTKKQGSDQDFTIFNAQGMVKTSYPFYSSYQFGEMGFDHVIEPVVAVIANNNSGKERELPNEDSKDLQLDYGNLFALNMNPGQDRFDEGTRVAYGLNNTFYGQTRGSLEVFIGQTKRFSERQLSQVGTGLDRRSSDIIGFVEFHPHPWLDANYYFRNDSHGFDRRYFRSSVDIGPKQFRPGMTYLFNDQPLTANLLDQRRQVTYRLTSQLTDEWELKLENKRNLANPNRGSLESKATLTYDNECFTFETHGARIHTKRNGTEPQDEVYARIIFKTIMAIKSPTHKHSTNNQRRLRNNNI